MERIFKFSHLIHNKFQHILLVAILKNYNRDKKSFSPYLQLELNQLHTNCHNFIAMYREYTILHTHTSYRKQSYAKLHQNHQHQSHFQPCMLNHYNKGQLIYITDKLKYTIMVQWIQLKWHENKVNLSLTPQTPTRSCTVHFINQE